MCEISSFAFYWEENNITYRVQNAFFLNKYKYNFWRIFVLLEIFYFLFSQSMKQNGK